MSPQSPRGRTLPRPTLEEDIAVTLEVKIPKFDSTSLQAIHFQTERPVLSFFLLQVLDVVQSQTDGFNLS